MKKRIVSMLLVLCIIICIFPFFDTKAMADSVTIDEITSKLKGWKATLNGKYWNYFDRNEFNSQQSYVERELKKIAQSGALDNPKSTNAELGVTDKPCTGSYYPNGCRSNYFSGGWQCFGFGWFIEYALFGSTALHNPSDWFEYSGSSLNSINLQPGDYVRYNNHSIVVLDTTNDSLKCVEAWGGSGCKISWSPGFNWNEYTTASSLLTAARNGGGVVYRYRFISDNKSDDKVETDSYLSKCTRYQTFLDVEVTKETTIKSLPCSKSTDSGSLDVYKSKVGEKYTVTAILKNSENNYWYETSYKGQTCYIFAGNTKVKEYLSDMKASGIVAPTQINQGKPFTIEANVTSDKTTIGEVFVFVSDGSKVVLSSSEKVSGKKYSLKNSELDKSIKFNDLAPGNYRYVLWAQELRYYSDGNELKTYIGTAGTVQGQYGTLLCDQEFKVVGKGHIHTYTSAVTDPTCTEGGFTVHKCSCGENYADSFVPELGHDFCEWFTARKPTETQTGLEKRICARCAFAEEREIAKLEHTHKYASTVIAPTCTEAGYTVHECSCGQSYSDSYVPLLGHDFSVWYIVKQPTEYEGGREQRACQRCEFIESRELEPLGHTGHSYSTVTVNPTCTDEGYTLHICACGDMYKDNTVPTAGHKWDNGKMIKEPAAGQPGEKLFTCTVCAETRIEKVSVGVIITNPFKDVKITDYFFDSVMWAVSNDVTSGLSATEFGPSKGCTRAQVVTFLWRAAGEPAPSSNVNPFKDVNEGVYYYNAVLWAVENGITTGLSADTFGPNANCNRGQIVTFLWRAMGKPAPESSNNPFTDVPESQYYYDAVLWAVEKDITTGLSATSFGPNSTCTRGQIVTFLYRAYK